MIELQVGAQQIGRNDLVAIFRSYNKAYGLGTDMGPDEIASLRMHFIRGLHRTGSADYFSGFFSANGGFDNVSFGGREYTPHNEAEFDRLVREQFADRPEYFAKREERPMSKVERASLNELMTQLHEGQLTLTTYYQINKNHECDECR